MAHKKAGGSSRNGRDTEGRRLGVKKFGGESRHPRQHHHPPARHQDGSPVVNVGLGKDHTIFAIVEGRVKFQTRKADDRVYVSVEKLPAAAE